MVLRNTQVISETDFIKKSERNATPANDADRVPRFESDGFLDPNFIKFGSFGDGSDGDVTISSPTTLTRDMYYNNLTVNSTLTTNGYRIYVKNTINGTGTVDWGTPNNGTVGLASLNRGTGGTQSGAGVMKSAAGSDGGGNTGGGTVQTVGQLGSAGATGGSGEGASPSSDPTPPASPTKEGIMSFSTYLWMICQGMYQKADGTFGYLTNNGSGGGGKTGNGGTTSALSGGGGAGASGGSPLICAKTWAGTFIIKSVGGNGGNGHNNSIGDGGGGAGGNGGCPIIVYFIKTWTGTYNIAGGNGGTNGGGAGQAGNNGNVGTAYEINLALML